MYQSILNHPKLGVVTMSFDKDYNASPNYGTLRPVSMGETLEDHEWLLSSVTDGCFAFTCAFRGLGPVMAKRWQDWLDKKWSFQVVTIVASDAAGYVEMERLEGVPSDYPSAMLDREMNAAIDRLAKKIEARNMVLEKAAGLGLMAA